MLTKIDAAIVVEGRTDVTFLESFIEAEFVITNGSDVPRGTIDYLKSLSMIKKIVVLTDPDSPGKRIRDILDQEIPGLYHAFVEKKNAVKKHKVGIAESNAKSVLEALEHLLFREEIPQGFLCMEDLYELGLCGQKDASAKRIMLGNHFHIGFGNAKTMLKRMNNLSISKHEIEQALEEMAK